MIYFDNTAPVKLKGTGSGLWVTLDMSQPESVLISEIDTLFKKLNHLAVNAAVILDTGGVEAQDERVERIRSRLIEKYDVARVTFPPVKRSMPMQNQRRTDLVNRWDHHASDVLMLRGRIRSGQRIETQRHIVICGDVNPGAEIISGGDIFVLGRLTGKAHAGNAGGDTAMVFALAFEASIVRIASYTLPGRDAVEAGPRVPEFALVENGEIRLKAYLQSNPFGKFPWPEAV